MKSNYSYPESNLPTPMMNRREADRKPLVLIIEDDENCRFLFRYVLEKAGYRVEEAADGEAGVRTCEKCRLDIVLMDAKLPVLDGFAAARRIRGNSDFHSLPIIFASAQCDDSSHRAAFAAGANAYLDKPIAIENLQKTLAEHLSNANFDRMSLNEFV